MGAAGAFDFQLWLHCTLPDEELSRKWPFFSPKRTFLVQKMWYDFKFWVCGMTLLHLKKSFAPVLSCPWRCP